MGTICLDPGHGGEDPGAVRDGLAEKEVTLQVALAAAAALQKAHRVVLTRESDRTLTLAERRRVAALAGADLFVSVHVNAAARSQAQGYEVLVRPEHDPASRELALLILDAVAERFPGRRNRGIRTAALAVLRQPRPSCLVEGFFLSNPEERALLARPQTHAALGAAIARGCAAFVQGVEVTPWGGGPAATGKGRTAPPAAPLPRRPESPPA
ncbi:MAG: N-acetylmuramoyl-L-alanine amidase [Armatimonadota bacterium]|nr:N-acetylmuramoyl-L-alanine amidase [Armatimonadota bacterium]MDR7426385.1 N-acetylmuramoyl-L-alanine amidase [Armatimonadota bacterium]MDR7463957.1 N-acetylmuramoyl-L-alanine amidase [Armatimonadota bacterium]MDR7469516.1 N-acetylmuramoyl-L-alanine amidase [Armatimonadota bacterium]MDR7473476.1 N-acetylmuramoyl-L-alanine amidase [Armatimonadota bacterium]